MTWFSRPWVPSCAPMQRLIRISEVFAPFHEEILARCGIHAAKRLGREYWLFPCDEGWNASTYPESLWLRWNMTVDHAWPCVPEKTENFLEKSALALIRKFATKPLQQIMVSPLLSGSPHPLYKKMSSQLQQRLRTEFPLSCHGQEPEQQDPQGMSMFALLGKEGLFASASAPRDCGGFFAGGSKHISHRAAHSISRAGAKVAEALHFLQLYRQPLPESCHWLELGASPGGMTAELLERGYQVTAVDRAPMDTRVASHPRLQCYAQDARNFQPPRGDVYDALLCDMNGSAEESLDVVLAQVPFLRSGAVVVFTMKTHRAATMQDIVSLHQRVIEQAKKGGLSFLAQTHLTYNRNEFTLFWEVP
jgi:23S rRNA (cytidine2498-2'-O)-methyltransferase